MTLYLLPNALHPDSSPSMWCPEALTLLVNRLDGIIGESEKPMRQYLKNCGFQRPIASIPQRLLNEHTSAEDLAALVDEIKAGGVWGYVTDAGLPCIADPGSLLVRKVRAAGALVQAFPGASSITQALILSGCTGQKFTFHGYPPKDQHEFQLFLKEIEQKGYTQLFIERPYANIRCIEQLRSVLKPSTWLTVVLDIGTAQEEVVHLPISYWKERDLAPLNNRPAVFVIG